MAKFCTSCGATLESGARFCTSCGIAIAPTHADASAPTVSRQIPTQSEAKQSARLAEAGRSADLDPPVHAGLPSGSTASVPPLSPPARKGRAAVFLTLGIIAIGALGGGGYWVWVKKQEADLLAQQKEIARLAEAKRVEEEAARREEELRRKLKEEEDLRQRAEQERQAAEARAADEARVRRQMEARAAEEASARRQAEAAAAAAARAQEDARRTAQAAEQKARAAVPPATGAVGYEAASAAVRRGDYRAAESACLAAAQAGDPRCQNLIGSVYANGQVGARTESDLRTAVDWFRRAAQQNLATAQFNLGVMYERGAGVPRDFNAAKMWYQRAAAQGNTNASLAIARLAASGR